MLPCLLLALCSVASIPKIFGDLQPHGCPGCLVETQRLQQLGMVCITLPGYSLQESPSRMVCLTKHEYLQFECLHGTWPPWGLVPHPMESSSPEPVDMCSGGR